MRKVCGVAWNGGEAHANVESKLADADTLLQIASDELQEREREREVAEREKVAALAGEQAVVANNELLRAKIAELTTAQGAATVTPVSFERILAEAQETGAVVVVSKAAKSVRKVASVVDVERLRTGLMSLRDVYAPYRRGELALDYSEALEHSRFKEGPSMKGRARSGPGAT